MKIHYIQPYALDKNIGREYNEACALIPDGDWICITDQDVMFLEPHTKTLIHDIAQEGECDLYVAVTNRLKNIHQLHKGSFNSSMDIKEHIEIARSRRVVFSHKVFEYEHTTAGMLMLFRKTTWAKHPFAEGRYGEVTFDSHFGDCVRHTGGKVGIMAGVYVFHLYRFGRHNPGEYIEHLQ